MLHAAFGVVPHILIAGGAAVVDVFLYQALGGQLVQLPVDGGDADLLRQPGGDLLDGEVPGALPAEVFQKGLALFRLITHIAPHNLKMILVFKL